MKVHFGEFVLDSGERVLLRDGVEQALEPKVFDCLALLVAQSGKLTSTEQLRTTLWPDVNVGEGALRRVINEARRALGDTGTSQSLIRTRKGLGYVFVPAVLEASVIPPAPVPAPAKVPQRDPRVSAWPFVGRQHELDQLRTFCSEGSGGGLCLLSGEAGAGKSSLLAHLQVHRGADVRQLLGHCRATMGLPSFWPFREIAAQLMRDRALRARAAPFTRPLRSVLRAFPELAGDALLARDADVPAQLRFELCEAFATLLRELSQAAPLWLVIEDLHWADAGSLEMLEAVARSAHGHALHVFVTYRPEAVPPGKALSQWLGRISGRQGVIGVHLPALGLPDVHALLREAQMHGWAGDAAQTLLHLTGGNALFLSELLRHALARRLPPETALPPSLNHIVAQRVDALPEPTQRRLGQAAVLGHEFALDVLTALSQAPTAAALLADLEPALQAGVLRPAGPRRDRLQFSHALVGDALVQRLTLHDRTAAHAAALHAWQRLRGAAAPSGVLAVHAFEAGVQLPAEERGRLCEQAGRAAFAELAFDRAALHLGRAVELREPEDSSRAAAELTLLWAKALLHADEPEDEVEAAFLKAADCARRAHLPELLAEAAIGYAVGDESSVRVRAVALRPEALELAEEAWARLSEATADGRDHARGELAYRLAAALCWMRAEAGELSEFVRAARLALQLAPPKPDPFRRHWLLALRRAAQIEPTADGRDVEQALLQADDLGPAQRIELWMLSMGARLTHADLEGYQRAVNEIARLVELLPQPWRGGRRGARVRVYMAIPPFARVTMAVIRGELKSAEQHFAAVREHNVRFGTIATPEQTNHIFCILLQLYAYQGRGRQLEPMLDRYLESNPDMRWYVALAKSRFALERGEPERAAQHYAALRETGFRPMMRGKLSLPKPETLVHIADVCRELGTPADAALLYDALLPRAGHCIQDGALICLGACDRALAELAFVQGRHADAERHFEAALAINERLGHQPECARTQLGWARQLLTLNRHAEALPRLHAARSIATRSGMAALIAQIEELKTHAA